MMINVLIVEDDPMVLEVNKEFLERMSFFKFLCSAESGRKALDLIIEYKPDLILLEMLLPDIQGLEILQEIRNEEIPTDIIIISAERDPKMVQQMFRLGAVDYLVKPFHFHRFKMALENYRKIWRILQYSHSISQKDIDVRNIQLEHLGADSLPKGLSHITMNQIFFTLYDQIEPITSEQMAIKLGMATVTARRYLDYLDKERKVKVHIAYGRVGRPRRYYSI